eukprot:UC4_evm5s125
MPVSLVLFLMVKIASYTTPSEPGNLRAAGFDSSAIVFWTRPSRMGDYIDDYEVQFRPALSINSSPEIGWSTYIYKKGALTDKTSAAARRSAYRTINNLESHTRYEFRVRALIYTPNSFESAPNITSSPWSASTFVWTEESTPSDGPSSIRCTPHFCSKNPRDGCPITLHWLPPKDPRGKITHTKLEYRVPQQEFKGFWITERGLINGSAWTVGAPASILKPYTKYNFRLTARTKAGPGPSKSVWCFTLPSAPTAPPHLSNAVPISSNAIKLHFSPTPFSSRNGPIDGYVIKAMSGSSTVKKIYTKGNDTHAIVSDLDPYKFYNFSVFAFNHVIGSYLLSPESQTISARTLEYFPKSGPECSTTTLSDSEIAVAWKEIPDEQKNGKITSYKVLVTKTLRSRDKGIVSSLIYNILGESNLEVIISGLEQNCTYSFQVAVLNSVGASPYGPMSLAKTFATTDSPTKSPTRAPTKSPTTNPTQSPSKSPTEKPSAVPSETPTSFPSRGPSSNPTYTPSQSPSRVPTKEPSLNPTDLPSGLPTLTPTSTPSISLSSRPTTTPSNTPTIGPTASMPANSQSSDYGFLGAPIWMNILLGTLIVIVIVCIVCHIRSKRGRLRKNLDPASPVQQIDFPARDLTSTCFGAPPLDSSDSGASVITFDSTGLRSPLDSGNRLGRCYTTPSGSQRSISSSRKLKRVTTSSSIDSRSSVNEIYEATVENPFNYTNHSRKTRSSSISSLTGFNLSKLGRRSVSSIGSDAEESIGLMENVDEGDFIFCDQSSVESDHTSHYKSFDSKFKQSLVLETIDEYTSPPFNESTEAIQHSEPKFRLATTTASWRELMKRSQNLTNMQTDF